MPATGIINQRCSLARPESDLPGIKVSNQLSVCRQQATRQCHVNVTDVDTTFTKINKW